MQKKLNKFIKSLISLIVCFGITLPIPLSALENDQLVYNEYELIIDRIYNANRKKGINYSEIKEAKEELETLKKHIFSLKKWSTSQLKAANYTDEQIFNITNYDGSDEMTSKAAALVTRISQDFTKNQYSKSKNRTDATVQIIYNINGVPSPNLNAALAVGLHDGGIWFDTSSGSMLINYAGYANGKNQYAKKTVSGNYASNTTGARKFQFPLHINNSSGNICYANKLTVTFSAGRQGKIAKTQCVQQFSRQPLLGGGASISFSVLGFSLNLGGTGKINFSAFQGALKKTVA